MWSTIKIDKHLAFGVKSVWFVIHKEISENGVGTDDRDDSGESLQNCEYPRTLKS